MGGIFKFLIKRVVKRHTTLQSKLAIDEAAVDVDGAADESHDARGNAPSACLCFWLTTLLIKNLNIPGMLLSSGANSGQ